MTTTPVMPRNKSKSASHVVESDEIVGEMSAIVLLMCTYCCREEQNGEDTCPNSRRKPGNCFDMWVVGVVTLLTQIWLQFCQNTIRKISEVRPACARQLDGSEFTYM